MPPSFEPSAAVQPDWEYPAFDVEILAPKRHRYAVGIPVFNENGRIRSQLSKMQGLDICDIADIVIADGGSSDRSVDVSFLQSKQVSCLLRKTGAGALSAQLRMFFVFAISQGYEGVIIVDGNDKDDTSAISDFTRLLDQGWDYVQGSRYIPGGFEEHTPLSRKFAVKLLHAPILSLAAGFRYTDTTNGFRSISLRYLQDRRLALFRNVFNTYNLHYYLSMMAPRLGYRVCETPVTRRYPATGELPSKIRGFSGNWRIFKLLIKTVLGHYQPSEKSK